MTNRCDSVDALMYAYYEMMRTKEENQMLKKNKDYVEFSLQYTSVDWARRSKDCPEVCLKGYSDFSFPGVPIMDVVCNEFDHKVVVVSKRDFEKLQKDNQHYREMAKQWEENYNLLLKKTGFTRVADLIDYICDPSMTSPEDKTLKEIIDECEKDYISERDKAEALQTENEQLKKKLEEFSPVPGYKDFLKALYPETSESDIEKLVWATEQLCCGRDLQHALRTDLENCKSVSSIQAKSIRSWKEATGCNTPEEAEKKIENLKGSLRRSNSTMLKELDQEISKWQKATGCSTPKEAEKMVKSFLLTTLLF